MESKYCKNLCSCINFHIKGIFYCNTLWGGEGHEKNNYYDKNFLEKFLNQREILIENIKKGIVPSHCDNCVYLEAANDKPMEINNKFKRIECYHWVQCNCACFYCSNRQKTKLKITNPLFHKVKGIINIYPYIKELKKRNLIDDDARFSIVGGECTLLKEFPDIIKFVIKNNYPIDILSNGILYEKYISKALNANKKSFLSISLDSGTSETFKKIKRVDKFNNVVKNLKKYVKETKENSNQVMVKYIILKGINDNKDEIDKFFDVCTNIGITNFFPSIEFCNSVKPGKNPVISDKICELYEYMKTKAKEINPNNTVSTYDFVELMIKNKSYIIK